MLPPALQLAAQRIPPGAWAVGVSGGADSVALLRLAAGREDVRLVVAHLDHETRGPQSRADAAFVADLARELGLACEVAVRSAIEARLTQPPANRSALYRACRRRFFADVVERHGLAGVLLAHHADDQAETVFHRLLRGSGPANLLGMKMETRLGGLRVIRPLLDVPRAELRAYLQAIGQSWREDVSNASDAYARNRHRRLLCRRPMLAPALLDLSRALNELQDWIARHAPQLPESVPLADLRPWPDVLKAEALKRWLIRAGAPPAALERTVMNRLLTMTSDAASPPRQHFPGRLLLSRRRGLLTIQTRGTGASPMHQNGNDGRQ